MNLFENLFHSNGFTLEYCKNRTVGSRSDRTAPDFYDWNSSPSQPFKLLDHNRLYFVREGAATVITNNDTVDLTAGYVYLFPSNSIVATRCADKMRHSYIHFFADVSFQLFQHNENEKKIPRR